MKPTMRWTLIACTLAGAAEAEAREHTERRIKESDVPAPVLQRVKKKHPTAKLTAFEIETDEHGTSYEVKITDAGKPIDVICAPDGTIRAEEEQVSLDALPDPVRQAMKVQPKYSGWTFRGAERVITDEKPAAATYEVKLIRAGKLAELVFTADGKLTKAEEGSAREKD